MNDVPWILALAAAGAGGGFLLARRAGPVLWLAWLGLPFAGLLALLLVEAGRDAAVPGLKDKLAFGWALYSLLIAPPWLAANLAGWALGRRLRKPRGARIPAPAAPEADLPALPGEGLPDWDHIDNPRVEPWDLRRRLCAFAVRGGFDPATMPDFDYPPGGTGECIVADKFGYNYLRLAAGRTLVEESSSNAERLCYQVLRHHAGDRARARLAARGLDPGDAPQEMRREIAAILAAIDPRWAVFFLRMRGAPVEPARPEGASRSDRRVL